MRIERLREVVVGAHAQAGDALGVAPLRGRDEDRGVAAGADGLEDGLAAQSWEHQVQHDEVDPAGIDGVDRGAPVAHHRDRVPVTFEVEPQEVAEAGLVLDHQDPGT